jgi:LysR family transcriptional regulator, glycine cleavage system transcriptional activator
MFSDLPSMASLRAFEAAARHLSFTQAAIELDMTQGAISQQIKNLEDLIGLKLFVRERNKIRLTEVGKEYLVSARTAITEIFIATDRAIDRQRGDILTVACLGTYSIKCLIPSLKSFIKDNPNISVRIRTLVPAAQAAVSDYDVSIQYGQPQDWPRLVARPLTKETFFPVCAPALMKKGHRLTKPSDLARHTIIRTASPFTLRDDWPVWQERAGIPHLKFAAEMTCDFLYPLYQAAIEGLGVAMGRSAVVKIDVADGRLVEPFSIRLPSPLNYHLVIAPERESLPKVQRFCEWAMDELADKGVIEG